MCVVLVCVCDGAQVCECAGVCVWWWWWWWWWWCGAHLLLISHSQWCSAGMGRGALRLCTCNTPVLRKAHQFIRGGVVLRREGLAVATPRRIELDQGDGLAADELLRHSNLSERRARQASADCGTPPRRSSRSARPGPSRRPVPLRIAVARVLAREPSLAASQAVRGCFRESNAQYLLNF